MTISMSFEMEEKVIQLGAMVQPVACSHLLALAALAHAVAALPQQLHALTAAAAPTLTLTEITPPAAPIEGGAALTVHLQEPLTASSNITCNIAWRMDSWSVEAPAWKGTLQAGGKAAMCGPMPPLPAEGPVDFFIQVGAVKSTALPLWTYATFSASVGMTPYFGPGDGELLLKVNDTALLPSTSAWSLSAVAAGGGVPLLHSVPVLGGDVKRAVPLSFTSVNATADVLLNLTLSHPRQPHPLRLQVRLLRVPSTVPGAVAVDHSTRGLLVGGEPFLPISWMTTMDSYGVDILVSTMEQMARRGANSIMMCVAVCNFFVTPSHFILILSFALPQIRSRRCWRRY